MPTVVIAGKTALCHKLVFEARYEQGYVYLDRCGTTVNRLTALNSGWVAQQINPQNAPLVHVPTGTIFNFGPVKYDFSLTQAVGASALRADDVDQFISLLDAVSQVVHEELTLRTFSRKGFRVWYLFPTTSDEESNEWLAGLGSFTTSPLVARSFEAVIQTNGYVVVLRASDRKLRIAANPVERLENLDLGSTEVRALPRSLPRGQREALLRQLHERGRVLANPQFAVMIDVDVFVESPIDINAADFARHSLALIEQRLPAALEAH
jgi:hypothetical protein